MHVAVICAYRAKSLISHIASTFASHGAALHLWALEETQPDVAAWTRGVGQRPKAEMWNALIPRCRNADLVLFTDDDIEFPPAFLPRYVSLIDRFGVDMSSPALTPDSGYTLIESIAYEGLRARRVNWVDQMICGVSARLAREVLPLPEWLGPASWGVEYFFADVLARNGWACAIFDELRVTHTFRPVGASYSQIEAARTLLTAFARHGRLSMIRSLQVLEEYPIDGPPRQPVLWLSADARAFLDVARPLLKDPLLLLMHKASAWTLPDDRHRYALDVAPLPCRGFFRAMLYVLACAQARGRPGAAEMIERALAWSDAPYVNDQMILLRRGVEEWYKCRRREPTLWHRVIAP
jgi:hypothetical protein